MIQKVENPDFENRALLYAEKYGIFVYKIEYDKMIYHEHLSTGIYKAIVDLNTMHETREHIKSFKY